MKALPLFLPALVLTVLCAGTTPALAQTVDAITFTQASPTALRLRIATATPRAGRVQVVRLSTGQTLFAETYDAPAYGHRFDFGRAPSGRYLVRLQSGASLHRCVVQVRTRALTSTVRVARITSRAMPKTLVIGSLQPQYVRLAAADTSAATTLVYQRETPPAAR